MLLKTVAQVLSKSRRTVVFTGAGISTESGIPDYRSQGGIWDKFIPVMIQDFMKSGESRIELWRQETELYEDLRKAVPNKAHLAIGELYRLGKIQAVITQNIDGLHQAGGMPEENVLELHGTARRVRCLSCGKITGTEEIYLRVKEGNPAPECPCGGYLKSDTVSFGQKLSEAVFEKANFYAGECDFFLVVGSTLLVHPSAHLPVFARENGAFLGILNLSETPCDRMSNLVIREKAGSALPAIVEHLKKLL